MNRSFGIDLIRTVSILIVILRHYGITEGFNFGFYAIEFLFVVSGYLIGQILLKEFYRTDEINASSVKRFMMRRWFRILPMYYFAILLKFIIVHDIGWNIFYYIFFLQNHFYGIDFYPVTWSLVIDEWFYLTIPFFLFFFMKVFGKKKERVLIFLILLVTGVNVLRFIWVYHSNATWESLVGNVPLRQDTLLIGVVMAFVKMKYQRFFETLNNRRFFISMSALILLFVAVFYQIRVNDESHVNDFLWTRTIGFGICATLIAFTLPYIENSVFAFKRPQFKFLNSFVVMGSKISYALYLFHTEVLEAMKYLFPWLRYHIGWRNAICIVLSILISYFLYQVLEKKFLILRDRYYPDTPIV